MNAIPADLRPISQRLHVAGDAWMDQGQHFGRWFHRAQSAEPRP